MKRRGESVEGEKKKGQTIKKNSKRANSSPFLPYLVALVLIADGQQIQQDLVEVAQGEVDAHHCHGVAGGHLRAGRRRRGKAGGDRLKKGADRKISNNW